MNMMSKRCKLTERQLETVELEEVGDGGAAILSSRTLSAELLCQCIDREQEKTARQGVVRENRRLSKTAGSRGEGRDGRSLLG
jgi:hypothetical protein